MIDEYIIMDGVKIYPGTPIFLSASDYVYKKCVKRSKQRRYHYKSSQIRVRMPREEQGLYRFNGNAVAMTRNVSIDYFDTNKIFGRN